jgi:hypothetical protein
MSVEIIGFVAIIVGVLGLVAGPNFIAVSYLVSTLLGSAAALILEFLGGAGISPAHFLLGFLAVSLLKDPKIRRNALRGLSFPKAGFWLSFTLVYSIFTAIFFPRIFAGMTDVFAVRSTTYALEPLAPSSANFTQSVFFTADVVSFFLFTGYLALPEGRRILAKAALACAALNLIFGLVDLVTYWTNTTELLSIIRNTNYRMLNDTEVAGFKRIVGSFTEAASFGSMTLGYFAFCFTLWLRGFHTRLALSLAVLSMVALVFSTSTTAYVGLAVLLLLLYLRCGFWLLSRAVPKQAVLFLVVAPLLVAIALVGVALNDAAWTYIRNLLDTIVFNKLATDSGVERSAWIRQALQNFSDTLGFGAGNGSLRASSLLAAIVGCLGIVGLFSYGAFFVRVIASSRQASTLTDYEYAVSDAAKSCCLAWFITATIAGAFIDLGLHFFVFAAVASINDNVLRSPNPFARRPADRSSLIPAAH